MGKSKSRRPARSRGSRPKKVKRSEPFAIHSKRSEAITSLNSGNLAGGLRILEALLKRYPKDGEALYLSAVAHYRLQAPDRAMERVQQLLAIAPAHTNGLNLLANLQQDAGQLEEAETTYRRALLVERNNPFIHNNHGSVLRALGRPKEAKESYERALALRPGYADTLANLGNLALDTYEFETAIRRYREAIASEPNLVRAWTSLGSASEQTGDHAAAVKAYTHAATLAPGLGHAQWFLALAYPILPTSKTETVEAYTRCEHLITHLVERGQSSAAQQLALGVLHERTAFNLHYRDVNHRRLQETLGRYLETATRATYPMGIKERSRPHSGRIRVGYVGGHMREHTVGKFVHGWVQHHDPAKVEVELFHLGASVDARTQALAELWPMHQLPTQQVGTAAKLIQAAELDVIIYPEVGMFGPAVQLASLRLAPLQCAAIGHPITTGLSEIDVFLSGEQVEPPEGDTHYSETLVRLPGLGITYETPPEPSVLPTRAELGFPEDGVLFFSGQSLFKYQPEHDWVFAEILARAPNASIAFLSSGRPKMDATFVERMARAGQGRGIDFSARCKLVSRRPYREFLGLYSVMDGLIDAPSWSGGNTSFEGLHAGKFVVTHRGAFARSRVSAGMLDIMGMSEYVAETLEAQVELATRFAQDAKLRASLNTMVAERSSRLFNNVSVVRAMEDLFQRVYEQAA